VLSIARRAYPGRHHVVPDVLLFVFLLLLIQNPTGRPLQTTYDDVPRTSMRADRSPEEERIANG
jgi:hypothetical protein